MMSYPNVCLVQRDCLRMMLVCDANSLPRNRLPLQEAAKQGGMKDEVAVQAMRHADRLIKLAPDNPASYEFRAYIEMHSLDAAFDSACM